MLAWICSWIYSTNEAGEIVPNWTFIILWFITSILPVWIVIFTNKRLKPNPVRDANAKPFTRDDYEKWSYLLTFFTHAFLWPLWIMGWLFICLGCSAFKIMRICKPGKPLTGLRFTIANNMCRFFWRCMLLTAGCV